MHDEPLKRRDAEKGDDVCVRSSAYIRYSLLSKAPLLKIVQLKCLLPQHFVKSKAFIIKYDS